MPVPGVPLQYYKYNTQSLLREVRYDPRLRLLTTFPVEETQQLRHDGPPAGTVANLTLTSSSNHTLVVGGCNQTELRVSFKLDPWPLKPTKVGVVVMTASASSTVGVELYVVVYPPPSIVSRVWHATAWCQRPVWGSVPGPANGSSGASGGPTMAGNFPIIAGENIDMSACPVQPCPKVTRGVN